MIDLIIRRTRIRQRFQSTRESDVDSQLNNCRNQAQIGLLRDVTRRKQLPTYLCEQVVKGKVVPRDNRYSISRLFNSDVGCSGAPGCFVFNPRKRSEGELFFLKGSIHTGGYYKLVCVSSSETKKRISA